MVLKLYKVDGSPPVRAVFMTIEAANIPNVEYVEMDLQKGDHKKQDYLKMNPQHTVPTLKDGDFCIWDSHAICVYLLTKYGNNESLYPVDPEKRAVIDQRLHFDSGKLFPALHAAVEPIFYRGQKAIRAEVFDMIRSAYDFSNKFLTKPWMAGDEITLADICCVATISSLDVLLPIDADLYPQLNAWFNRCKKQDFYIKGNESGLVELATAINGMIG